MRFIIATSDYSGLGFAIRLQDEGHQVILGTNPPEVDRTPERLAIYNSVGEGMLRKERLCEVIEKRREYVDAYWIWDHNHSVEENETLRSEGFKVFGGGRYANSMEHDRDGCLQHARSYGLFSPPSHRFEDTRAAIEFCKQHRRTAYVYKPDEGANFETFVPESEDDLDANEEVRLYLASIDPKSAFILQERKEGIETNVEVWFQGGEPVFAFMALESKRRCALDLGELVGGAFDFAFVIPLSCRAVKDSVGSFFPHIVRCATRASETQISSPRATAFGSLRNARGSVITRIPTYSSTCPGNRWRMYLRRLLRALSNLIFQEDLAPRC